MEEQEEGRYPSNGCLPSLQGETQKDDPRM